MSKSRSKVIKEEDTLQPPLTSIQSGVSSTYNNSMAEKEGGTKYDEKLNENSSSNSLRKNLSSKQIEANTKLPSDTHTSQSCWKWVIF